jgi:hypothetical protein
VTASVLYDFVQCPQHVALDAFGDAADRDAIKAFVRLLWDGGALFERETIARLGQPFTDLTRTSDIDRERLTFDAMARADSLIYGGFIHADDLLGVPDLRRWAPMFQATSNPAGARKTSARGTMASQRPPARVRWARHEGDSGTPCSLWTAAIRSSPGGVFECRRRLTIVLQPRWK